MIEVLALVVSSWVGGSLLGWWSAHGPFNWRALVWPVWYFDWLDNQDANG